MGERGKDAIVKPQEPPQANGRPRNRGPRKIVRKARASALDAVAFLVDLVKDVEAEPRYRLRAAAELLKVACLDIEEPETKKDLEKFEVIYRKDFRATGTDDG